MAKIGTVLSAIMASSCCWLPPILLLAGVSGAGIVATLEAYRPLLMVVTFGFLGMAFYFTYRPSFAKRTADCCSPAAATPTRRGFSMMTVNKIMLWGVTGLAIVFLFFPQHITGLLGADGGKVTGDMQSVVVKVTGMTCPG